MESTEDKKSSNEATSNESFDDFNTAGANPKLLSQLLDMGVNKNLSIRALLLSGNDSVESAITFISELSAEECEMYASKPWDADEWEDVEPSTEWENVKPPAEQLKMVFVVNSSLNMTPGKIAAQVAHGALGLYRTLRFGSATRRHLLFLWQDFGEKSVVLKAESTLVLEQLSKKAVANNLPVHHVYDQGLTQVPSGSFSVLSLFGKDEEVNPVTGHLKLL